MSRNNSAKKYLNRFQNMSEEERFLAIEELRMGLPFP